jgi:hypothetical protein
MADPVEGIHAWGKRMFRSNDRKREATPGPSSIPIDPILLKKSMNKEKLYSDTDSDSDICFLCLVLSHYLYISRAIFPRACMKISLHPSLTSYHDHLLVAPVD